MLHTYIYTHINTHTHICRKKLKPKKLPTDACTQMSGAGMGTHVCAFQAHINAQEFLNHLALLWRWHTPCQCQSNFHSVPRFEGS